MNVDVPVQDAQAAPRSVAYAGSDGLLPNVGTWGQCRSFSALTRGSTIRIHYNQRQYDIDVVDIKPVRACTDACLQRVRPKLVT